MIGKTFGHYHILEELGAGGMGVVYRALDDHLERDVAIKVLPPGTVADESVRTRIRKDAITQTHTATDPQAVAREIRTELSPQDRARLGKATPVNPAAHEAYLKGRYYISRPRSSNKAEEYLKQAIDQQMTWTEEGAGSSVAPAAA
jgi:serine/threonine protein kinase